MTTIELYAIYKEHSTISTDTRKIAEGSIFFALKGPNFNANTLVGEALKKGAIVARGVLRREMVGDTTTLFTSQCPPPCQRAGA